MPCSISSIVTLCLGAPTDTLSEGFASTSEIVQIDLLDPGLFQSWMRQNLSSQDIESGVFDSLAALVYTVARIRCSISNTTGQIECSLAFSF